MNKTTCKECTNNNCLIKKHIERESMQSYIERKSTFKCQNGQQFILEGAPVSGLYFIFQGAVKVYKSIDDSSSQIIRLSKDGEIVGHRGFGTNYVYDISASAMQDTILCHFQSDILIDMLHKTPELMYDFMLFYADQLQKSESNAKLFGRMTVKDKVINGLLFIQRKFGQDNEFFNLTFSRKDIAEFAGTSQEQVIRVISALKKEGLVSTKGKKIGILNSSKIEAELSESGYFLEG
ncbi:Crp/Fnr family transcriptional regulator [Saccharicrinis aurantiacus]|uniref:Crp/Fnr family transcriptional regulator n=1 Tax=Saccharicrinis aurantiacus TaxID=1849719 RepID=UPI00095030A5|nr:Crp/Fnr family transcriptional regulator [Saccharicrinis aurantiacus]